MAPAFRVGYLVASAKLIHSLSSLRRILDRQGDLVLEEAIAELLENGTIRRHLRKSWKLYKERRDKCCTYLDAAFGDVFDFQPPKGGLAIWSKIAENFPVEKLRSNAMKLGLHLFDPSFESQHMINGARFGFASLNQEELDISVDLLKQVIRKI